MKLIKYKEKDYSKDLEAKRFYDINCVLQTLSSEINEIRTQRGMTQKELANKAGITQQQLSKVELGANCNMSTFISVASVLGLDINLVSHKAIKNDSRKKHIRIENKRNNLSNTKKQYASSVI
ncbi:helix-turn-helix transcriptional regulator [uncultured Brachyspira sp.]|uniref:helix-turn-helix domain-containing protein n=1 Tax=uncultured Brachyspira sp. TaxID=221953 RepID=UPI00258F57ED|nr:helix-turn-helix transcriptional regulator [uncultured Brachyspira sp.]